MNFGQNLYQWFLSNAQSLVLMAIVVIGIYLGFKREFSKLIGFLVVALIAVGLVFNAGGVKDVLLELFNKIIGAWIPCSGLRWIPAHLRCLKRPPRLYWFHCHSAMRGCPNLSALFSCSAPWRGLSGLSQSPHS